MNKTIKRVIRCIPMILVMFIIFGFSAGTGEESSSLSYRVSEIIVNWCSALGIDISVDAIHLPVRKIAHMTEYGILAITALLAFCEFKKMYLWAFGISVIYATIDEFHQFFVDGRCASLVDVLIDSLGAFLALLLMWGIMGLCSKKKRRE